jgi:cytochrome c oxidase assembly protein subunit 11
MNEPGTSRKPDGRHRRVALACAAVAVGMVGLAYASVPLYRMFCQATGYAGTTQRAERPSSTVLDRTVTIRFDGNVAPGLTWTFEPVVRTVDVKVGENTLAFFRAHNTSDRTVTGTAAFNVTPEGAGAYFVKIACFCFTEQRLGPGESVDMPVSFYVDPAIAADKDARTISEITLSYTFYPVAEKAAAAGRQSQGGARPGGRGDTAGL